MRGAPRRPRSTSSPTTSRATFHNVEHHRRPRGERVLRLAVRRGGDPHARRLRRLRARRCWRTARGNQRRGARARPLPALARDLLHGRHAVARLPEVRRRGQGDGPRALRRPGAAPASDARARPARRRRSSSSSCDYFVHHEEGVDMTWDERHADDRPPLLRPDGGARSGPRASRDDRADAASTRTSPPRSRRCSRRRTSTSFATAHERTRLDEPLPRRRRRAERRRERAHPAGDAVRRASTSSRRPATRARRSAPPSTSGTRSSAGRAAS